MASLLHHSGGVVIPRSEYEELTEALATVLNIASQVTRRLIERLDQHDGDPDREDDDPCGQCDEDGINTNLVAAYGGPGCELSDPGGCEHDGREPEWGA